MTSTVNPTTAGAGGAREDAAGPAGARENQPAYGPPSAYPAPPVAPDRLTRLVDRVQARAPRWAAPLAVLGCVGGAVGFTLLTHPAAGSADGTPSCLVKLTTGLDCPGCGGTRAAWYLLHGNLGAAARHHLIFVFAVPFLLYFYVAWSARVVFGRRLPQLRITPTAVGVFLGAWLLFSVLRNLPWVPFSWFYV
ncbi:MAG TPA: DUF2752 domain-containing protein [Micromonosporaceae bacterium]